MDREKFLVWCVVKRNLAKNSIKHTRQRYDLLIKWLGDRTLTAETVESYILYLREKGLRNASLNSHIRVVNLIDIFERENDNDLNLLKKISYFPKQTKVPTILSIDEIDAILQVEVPYQYRGNKHTYNHSLDETYRMLWWLVSSTGCRIEEALNVKKGQLMLGLQGKGKVIYTDTKTNEDRKVPIPPILVFKLHTFVEMLKPTEYIFRSTTGNRLSTTSAEEDIKKRADLAGIQKHIYPHCFRNSYIMEHYRRNTDPFTISRLVGHRDINTTLGYMKFDDDDLEKGAENHPLFSRSITPQRLINKLKEAIASFKLDEDFRFTFNQTEGNNSFSFTVFIK